MRDSLRKSCELLIQNRDRVKKVYAWEGGLIRLACAAIYTMKDRSVDEEVLEKSKRLLKEKMGIFSNFRGTASAAIAAMLAVSGNPERTLDNGIAVYELLKKEFLSSTYLPLAAMVIAQLANPSDYGEIAGRTRRIYERMKAEHPFLTSGEDSALCALLALSDRTDDELIDDMEACYALLKKEFFSNNAVQSLSHVLSLCAAAPEEKCRKTMELFNGLKAAGRKYGTESELSTLGILTMIKAPAEELIQEMLEVDKWLSDQKDFGFFGSVDKKQRLMYAGMLVQKEFFQGDAQNAPLCGDEAQAEMISGALAQTAMVGSSVAVIVAQQAAICAVIAASASVSAASAASSAK